MSSLEMACTPKGFHKKPIRASRAEKAESPILKGALLILSVLTTRHARQAILK
jgi:hypothetical protein